MSAITNTIFSPELAARFDKLVTIYPVKRSALVPMLLYAQDEVGYVSDEVVAELAERLDLLELDVRSVLSYYSMLRTKPAGDVYKRQVAMLFILFDVEAVFMLPWAVIYRRLPGYTGGSKLFGFWEILVYLGFVAVGLFYVWKKGILDWSNDKADL